MPVPLRHTIKALWFQKQKRLLKVQKNTVAKMRSII